MNKEQLLTLAIQACRYAIEYDNAIRECANNPKRMHTFCTVKGETLDLLYMRWQQEADRVLELNGEAVR